MKKIITGVLIGFALASTIVMAQQGTEKRGGMMGGMMQGQKGGEDSGSSMQGMMAMMMKMMEQCNAMMGGGGMMGGGMMGKGQKPETPQKEKQ